MNNRPSIQMYGEVDGDRKGIEIRGDGGNLYEGSFNTELHGINMKKIGIKNDYGSIAHMSDIETDSPIVNTGGSFMELRRAKIVLRNGPKREWWNNSWFNLLALVATVFTVITFVYWIVTFL